MKSHFSDNAVQKNGSYQKYTSPARTGTLRSGSVNRLPFGIYDDRSSFRFNKSARSPPKAARRLSCTVGSLLKKKHERQKCRDDVREKRRAGIALSSTLRSRTQPCSTCMKSETTEHLGITACRSSCGSGCPRLGGAGQGWRRWVPPWPSLRS